MENSFFLLLFFILGIFYLLISWWVSRHVKDSEDYFLANRSIGFLSTLFTLVATQIGGGAVIGLANKSYEIGFYSILYGVGMSLGFFILSLGLASRWRSLNIGTSVEIFKTKYHSPGAQKLASLISAISLFGLLVGQAVALKLLLAGLGISSTIVLSLFWTVIVFQTMLGGLKAVVIVDFIQAGIILIFFLLVFLYSSWELSTHYTTQDFFSLFLFNSKKEIFKWEEFKLTQLIFMPLLFSLFEQDFAQRIFAVKDKKVAVRACLMASFIIFAFSFIPIHFGIRAKVLAESVLIGQSVLIVTLKNMLNPFALSVLILAITSAIFSTANSLLCAVCSNICLDFEIKKSSTSKIVTLLVGLYSFILGVYFDDVLNILIKSCELAVSTLFVPIMMAIYGKNLSPYSAWSSILAGSVAFFLQFFLSLPFPHELFSLFLSSMAFFITQQCTRKIQN